MCKHMKVQHIGPSASTSGRNITPPLASTSTQAVPQSEVDTILNKYKSTMDMVNKSRTKEGAARDESNAGFRIKSEPGTEDLSKVCATLA